MNMLRKLLWAASRPVIKMFLRAPPTTDPWNRFQFPVPDQFFSVDMATGFRQYFASASTVPITNLDEVCQWLLAADYVADPEPFQNRETWQDPTHFEQRRKGNCACHALWAWRKLTDLGYTTEFLAGEIRRPDGSWGQHAWVCFDQKDGRYLFESTAKERRYLVRRLADARDDYCPRAGIEANFAKWGYYGHLHALHREFWPSKATRRLTSA
jgi:hypothetical protein